jgi:hypothetical protein
MVTRPKLSGRCVLASTWITSALFLEDALVRALSIAQHASFLKAVIGVSLGSAYAVLSVLTIAQAASAVALVSSHASIGTTLPCAVFLCTMGFEFVAYNSIASSAQCTKTALVASTVLGIALLRRDRAVRRTTGVPLDDAALVAERVARNFATRARASVAAMPLAAASALRAMRRFAKLGTRGPQFEMQREAFATNASLCALMLLFVSLDKSSSVFADTVAITALKARDAAFSRFLVHREAKLKFY